MLVHGTCVDISGAGVLIMGPSGAGKSDLALRLIADGAFLVSDDQTILHAAGVHWVAHSPDAISGLLEVRGCGILAAPRKAATQLRLAVQLPNPPLDRLPEPGWWSPDDALKPRLPLVLLDGREPSAPAKVRITLSRLFGCGAVVSGEVPSVVERGGEADY
jgi:hypothetical protein